MNSDKPSERLKIRSYILGLVHHAGTGTLKVPSANQLASQFGVNRLTARAALEQLIDEGYLVAKVGSGTFTNPEHSFQLAADRRPLIGVLCGNGDDFFYLYTSLEVLSGTFSSLAARHCDVRLFDRFDGGYVMSVEMICATQPDALLWFAEATIPEEYLKKVRDAGIRVITLSTLYENIGGVTLNRTSAMEEALRTAYTENRRRAMVLHRESWMAQKKTQEIFETNRLFWSGLGSNTSMELRLYSQNDTKLALLEELLKQELPDLLILPQSFAMLAQNFFEAHGVDLNKRLRLLAEDGFPEQKDFRGFVISDPWKKMGETAVSELLREMENPKSQVRHVKINSSFLNNVCKNTKKKGK